MEQLLLTIKQDAYTVKDVYMQTSPERLRPILNPVSWRILTALSQKPMYPAELARELGVYEQSVYYYVKRLEKAGFIKLEERKYIKGAAAKYYRAAYPAFGVEIPGGEREFKDIPRTFFTPPFLKFFEPFAGRGEEFNGLIVVGSPEPHGPRKTVARDGHYGVQLAFLLGQLCRMPSDFIVKLDVDVKTEKEEGGNLLLIGGPGTNLITADVNPHLPIKFDEVNYWAGLRDSKGGLFNYDQDGLVAKIRNPFNKEHSVIVVAGVRHVGTKAAVIAVTKLWREVFKEYRGEDEWAIAVRGFDMDGDGKVDSVELLSS